MKQIFYKVMKYIKYVFKGIVDKQVEMGNREREQNWGTANKTKISVEEKKQLLEKFTIKEVAQGWRLNAQTENSVVLEYGKKPNHILHFLLCIPTFGFWIIVWIILAMSMTIKRKTWVINEYGEIKQYIKGYSNNL